MLKLKTKNQPIRCSVALETSKYCQLNDFFLPSQRKDLLQHKVDNEVSALATIGDKMS